MKKTYKINNLDCVNCAAKIEAEVAALPQMESASLSFATGMLSVQTKDNHDPFNKITQIVKRLEPDCTVQPQGGTAEKEPEEKESMKVPLILLILSLAFLGVSLLPIWPPVIKTVLIGISTILSAYPTLKAAVLSLRGRSMNENLLVSIAIIAAFVIGEYYEAAVVSLFFRVGEWLEDWAVLRSRRSISALTEIRADKAWLVDSSGSTCQVPAEEVQINDVIQVNPYERVPLDGEVIEGQSAMDASSLTGESLPVDVSAGAQILSGMMNGSGALKVRVTGTFENSAASRIIQMVEESASRKGSTERLVTRISKYYTPIVTLCAVLIAVIPSLFFGNAQEWIHRALIFLVASCPCALVLSIPLGFFAGIGGASRKGILVKGGKYLEVLEKAQAVVFDKTGTLTTGEFTVDTITAVNGFTQDDVLKYAAYADANSSHPIALSICKKYGMLDKTRISDVKEYPARGTSALIDGKLVLCGNETLMKENNIDISGLPAAPVYVAVDGTAAGSLEVSDTLRDDVPETMQRLRELGVKRIVMLTGDHEKSAARVAKQCGITEYHSGLLPAQKLEFVEKIKKESGVTVFVGDGINDAPVLAGSDAGVAMGFGTDAAIEAADVVLMNSKPSKLAQGIALSRKTLRVVKFNIVFALIVKAVVLVGGAAGLSFVTMWAAVLADVGVSVLSVANSARLLKK